MTPGFTPMLRSCILACLVAGGAMASPLLVGLSATPTFAQSAVTIDGPPQGEVVLNRDIEVRLAPHETSRILRTLQRGQALNALDTPRGSRWTLIAIGGQPVGYVPSDALDPALMRRGAEPPANG